MNAHIIYIPFTGVGLHGGFRGNAWYKFRIEIFKNYTLKSLINQSNKNFILWLSFRSEERDNPFTQGIIEELDKSGLNYLCTFDGLMYTDDRFSNYTLKTKIRNLLQMLWDGYNTKEMKPLKEIWKYTWENKNETLLKRLTSSLSQIKSAIGDDYDWIYLTRIDSDDMFHKDAMALVQSQEPANRRAFSFQNGYMYNVVTGQLAEWIPPTNPPFHTIVFPASAFFNPVSHKEYYRDFKSHEDIPRVFDTVCLDDNQFCVTAHDKHHITTAWDVPIPKHIYQKVKYFAHTTSGRNISTRWEGRTTRKRNVMLGKEFRSETEKKEILANFGL